jgi:anti-sigma factor RsiW
MGRRHLSAIELTEYGDGQMSPARMGRAEEHLRRCDACALALSESRRGAAIAGRLRPVALPPNLHSRIAAALAHEARRTLTCDRVLPLLHSYLDRSLSPLFAVPLQSHLDRCPRCRRELVLLLRAAHLVRTLPSAPVPAEVRERVAAASRLRLGESPWGVRLRPALAAAGLAAVGLLALLLRPGLRPTGAKSPPVAGVRAAAPALVSGVRLGPPVVRAEAAQPEEVAASAVAPSHGSAAAPLDRAAPKMRDETAGASLRRPYFGAGRKEHSLSGPKLVQIARAAAAPAGLKAMPRTAAMVAALPTALQALRAVAKKAEYEQEARRAMDLAAESFATLNSEEMLNRFPEPTGLGGSNGGPEHPAISAPPAARPAETTGPGHDSALAPEASDLLATGPLA